MIIFNYFIF